MNLSFNEIEALASKAARGAGLSWGLAEEAGFAARWLAEHDLDWAGALLARCGAGVASDIKLEVRRVNAAVIRGDGLCPVRVGAYLADASIHEQGCDVTDVAAPMLLLPFLSRAAKSGPLTVRIGSVAQLIVDGVELKGTAPLAWPGLAPVLIAWGASRDEGPSWRILERPAPVSAEQAAALAAYERLTYVPASAQSRLAGAGAGLSDND